MKSSTVFHGICILTNLRQIWNVPPVDTHLLQHKRTFMMIGPSHINICPGTLGVEPLTSATLRNSEILVILVRNFL